MWWAVWAGAGFATFAVAVVFSVGYTYGRYLAHAAWRHKSRPEQGVYACMQNEGRTFWVCDDQDVAAKSRLFEQLAEDLVHDDPDVIYRVWRRHRIMLIAHAQDKQ